MPFDRPGYGGGKAFAVDRQRPAGRHLVGVGGAHDQRAELAHLGVQQPDGIVGGIIGAEGIGADELGQPVSAVGFGHAGRAHFVQNHAHAALGHLPGGLGAGKAPADDMDGF